ncbi:MAG TPA: zf-HC2 domain-containing protein, partial [Candidatus Acidoferrum sp.]|nr:zf-HC2 domain-containing protein [Candidatus Acidoferrum sp.]
MNCFEARQEFPALWRKTLASEQRAELVAHLKGCEKCDHAFRFFALTAPVLHGEMEQQTARDSRPARREFSLTDRPRRFASAPPEAPRQRRLMQMAAAAAIFVFASSAAYLSARVPDESIGQAFSLPDTSMSSETTGDPLAPEMPQTESDIAG